MAGLAPCGVLGEVLNERGDRASRTELLAIAERHRLEIISIEQLIAHRRVSEKLVSRIAQSELPTPRGRFSIIMYDVKYETQQPFVLVMGDLSQSVRAAGSIALQLLHRRPARVVALRLR